MPLLKVWDFRRGGLPWKLVKPQVCFIANCLRHHDGHDVRDSVDKLEEWQRKIHQRDPDEAWLHHGWQLIEWCTNTLKKFRIICKLFQKFATSLLFDHLTKLTRDTGRAKVPEFYARHVKSPTLFVLDYSEAISKFGRRLRGSCLVVLHNRRQKSKQRRFMASW